MVEQPDKIKTYQEAFTIRLDKVKQVIEPIK